MICSICSEDKASDLFPKTPSGFRSYCKACYKVKRYEQRQIPERKAVHNAACRRGVLQNKERRRLVATKWREKNRAYFSEHKKSNRGLYNYYGSLRRAAMKRAVPSWFNKEEVAYIYKLAKERGLVVDHIVPLNSDLVCGLHVQDNLRCISAELNAKKGNRYWPDMAA